MSNLVLIRHGQSLWNLNNLFTGWVDVPLSEKGIEEAQNAGKALADFDFDVIYVSTLVRAMQTAMIAMAYNKNGKVPIVNKDNEANKQEAEWAKIYNPKAIENSVPVFRDWHLNERCYGELQGLDKAETAEKYGTEQVHIWRRSYDTPPPNGEALKNTADRTIPFFKETIIPLLAAKKDVLISAHGNSLRSIVMYLDNLSQDQVLKLEIKTGDPILYKYTSEGFTKGAL